jgi:hypothetical protein
MQLRECGCVQTWASFWTNSEDMSIRSYVPPSVSEKINTLYSLWLK